MRTDKVLLIGAGGHCKVVIDALLGSGVVQGALRVADDAPLRAGSSVLEVRVAGTVSQCLQPGDGFHVAVGHNSTRERLAQVCEDSDMVPLTVQHPRAVVSGAAHLGPGCLVAAGAVLAPGAQVGAHCILNHGAVVDHDCVVGAFTHIAPHATLGGGVRIGRRVLVGAGATLLPGVSVGDDCTIGAGAVVLHDLPAGSTFAGVPAHRIDGNTP